MGPTMFGLFRYRHHVARVFTQLREGRTVRFRRPVDALRLAVFSDHHRGDLTAADDFLPCRDTYHGALEQLLGDGYELVLLGDVEELWEAEPRQVVENYGETLRLEREFARRGRLWRLFGNHDDAWSHPDLVLRHLGDYLTDSGGTCAGVFEAMSIEVTDGGRRLGEILLAHGHQGTLDSDRLALLSRFFVRWFWRPWQRLFRLGYSTPATDYRLRLRHEQAMQAWAEGRGGVVLVTGHTHRPVFGSQSHESQLAAEIETIEHRLPHLAGEERDRAAGAVEALKFRLSRLLAEIGGGVPVPGSREPAPCYFNSGCCSFPDGDITAVEIADGRIRLVKWSIGSDGRVERTSLRSLPLIELFARLPPSTGPG